MKKKTILPTTLLLFTAFCLQIFACQPNVYQGGERIYTKYCANCHMDNGEGLSALIPTLAKSDFLAPNRDKLPCIILHGIKDTIVVNGKTYAEEMPAMPTLSDIQITNVLNFINSSWGNQQEPYKLEEVRALLERCP